MTLYTGGELASSPVHWAARAYRQFSEEILNPAYPCYFGAQAERQGFLRYAVVTGDDLLVLKDALSQFVKLSRGNPKHRHVLVAFFDKHSNFEADSERFWHILQWLHDHDPEPWPTTIPRDPDAAGWEFCFNQDPMFVFPIIPNYERRRSRGPGNTFAVCFQPRRIFAGVNRDDPGGDRIRADIYARVRQWDRIPPHPMLEPLAYGDQEMREWKQYVLPDSNGPLLTRCPISIGGSSMAESPAADDEH